jgi:hypothetical protein
MHLRHSRGGVQANKSDFQTGVPGPAGELTSGRVIQEIEVNSGVMGGKREHATSDPRQCPPTGESQLEGKQTVGANMATQTVETYRCVTQTTPRHSDSNAGIRLGDDE